ncbi:MAG: hypothetical protein ACLFP4_11860 [Spirochaetales bacterium]
MERTNGQITIYLDKDIEQRLRKAARDAGIPVSRCVASVIEQHTRTEWPTAVRDAAGSWPDLPDEAAIRQSTATDVPREPL